MMNPMNEKEYLLQVKDLIKDPKNWCKGTYVKFNKSEAGPGFYSYCLIGACGEIAKKYNLTYYFIYKSIYLLRENIIPNYIGITNFNDMHEYQDVIDLLDRTISKLED